MPRRVLVCGDRNWSDRQRIAVRMRRLKVGDVVIHGAAPGADSMAGEIASGMGLAVEEYPAQWEKFGRAAGPIRNRQMLREGRPTVVWAFHSNLKGSRGTKNMIDQALKAGIPVELFS